MNEQTSCASHAVGAVEPRDSDATLHAVRAYAFEGKKSHARAVAARLVAENRLLVGRAASVAVHAITAHYATAAVKVVKVEPLLSRRHPEVADDVIGIVVAKLPAVVPNLLQVPRINFVVPEESGFCAFG